MENLMGRIFDSLEPDSIKRRRDETFRKANEDFLRTECLRMDNEMKDLRKDYERKVKFFENEKNLQMKANEDVLRKERQRMQDEKNIALRNVAVTAADLENRAAAIHIREKK